MNQSHHFDILILGTGLPESLLAGAYARRGLSVLHVDPAPFYGGPWCGLSGHLFSSLQDKWHGFSQFEHRAGPAAHLVDLASDHSQFAVELAPKLIYAQGSLVNLFSNTGIGRNLDFKLVQSNNIASLPNQQSSSSSISTSSSQSTPSFDDKLFTFNRVPASKEDIFASKVISLLDKRKLMKFFNNQLTTNSSTNITPDISFRQYLNEHDLKSNIDIVLSFGVALLTQFNDNTSANDGLSRVHKYLNSLGRFGNSPFLMCMYGGGGEICQSLCRISAVYGGVYILGRTLSNVTWNSEQLVWEICIDNDLHFTASRLVGNSYIITQHVSNISSIPAHEDQIKSVSYHAIVIATKGVQSDTELGLYLIPIPLDSDIKPSRVVQILDMSSDLRVCPEGYHVLQFRATSRNDIDYCIERLIPTTSIIHTMYYNHDIDPKITIPDGMGPIDIVSSVSSDLDIDVEVEPIITKWMQDNDHPNYFIEPLPNPEEEQLVNEARQLKGEMELDNIRQ